MATTAKFFDLKKLCDYSYFMELLLGWAKLAKEVVVVK